MFCGLNLCYFAGCASWDHSETPLPVPGTRAFVRAVASLFIDSEVVQARVQS